MPTKYSIYKITNTVNQKLYIGFTSLPLNKRLKMHFLESKSGDYVLHKAMRKYGTDKFKIESIFESMDKEYTLNVVENMLIKESGYYESY